MTERIRFHFSLSCIGEGNGSPLQCSCLENPRDGGAWWAAISGVAQSRTRLKRLSSSSNKFTHVLVSYCYCTNHYKHGGLTQHIHYLTVLEVRSLKYFSLALSQGVGRATILLEALEKNPFLCLFYLVETLCIPWHVAPSFIFKANIVVPTNL